MQEGLGFAASNLESISNVFNFTFPFLSFLGLVITILVTLLLFILPMRWLLVGVYVLRTILLVWGVNKITKKVVRPWASASNELLDFLSRVPDSLELQGFTPLPDTQVTQYTT